jgi:small-conductance mechanosensitive channel
MFWGILMKLPVVFRKLLPTIILVAIGVLAGATDVFSEQVRILVSSTLQKRAAAAMPMAINLLIVAILFNIAYLLYHPSVCGLERVLSKSPASDRAKTFTMRAAKLLYWIVSSFVIVSLFAPELMGKMVLGFSVLGAAITLALQDAAKNFISGLRVQFTMNMRPGDEVKCVGAEIEGKIVDIGYLSTIVDTEKGPIVVPNTQLWEKPVLRKKPEKSKIILPPGCELDDATHHEDEHKEKP